MLFIYLLAKLLLYASLFLDAFVEARAKDVPVGISDPDPLSIKTMNPDRGYSVDYLEYCLRKYVKKKLVMFAHNCGGHWIVVIIVQK